MTVTLSAALLMGAGVVILCRYAGLRIWHADGDPDPLWYLRDELTAADSAADAPREPR